jgi:hypothetical protein
MGELMIMEYWRNDTDSGGPKNSEKKGYFECYSVYCKCHME